MSIPGAGDDYRSVVSYYCYVGAGGVKADLDYPVYSVRFSPPGVEHPSEHSIGPSR